MDIHELIKPGMVNEAVFLVEEQHLAQHIGSGSLRVLATPAMIAFMERVSHLLIAKAVPESYSSVGVLVNVRHLAPTPLGSRVRIKSEVVSVEGLQVTFHVEAWDEREQIGSGIHQRAVIEHERFLRRVAKKTPAALS
ncbi:MAG: thioesterase family protein [Omnitrophica WOR_2 bacterium]